MFGIVTYGYYVPKNRITVEEISKAHGKQAAEISTALHITEKAVAGLDEDTVTMAFEATAMALEAAPIDRETVDIVLFGSETHPYAVKPASTIVAEWLGIGNNHYLAYDTQFACKAATGALFSAFSAVRAGDARHALVCGVDKANAKIGDALEFTAGSGAVSLIVGSEHVALEVLGYHSYASDTPDFWRRPKASHPSHGGRFTGKPAYFKHIYQSSTALMEKLNLKPEDVARAVFHMPNGRFPKEISKALGFTTEQLAESLVVSYLGNSYAASALMGLAATLQHVKPGDLIFFASYGSGAGSDAMVLRATQHITRLQIPEFSSYIADKKYIDYTTYLKFMRVIA
jgi:hydroxymethylglutaryl-CoA synthase